MTAAFEYLEVVGISTSSIEAAVKAAADQAAVTRKIAWFEIKSVRGRMIDGSGEVEYQVTVKFGCKI